MPIDDGAAVKLGWRSSLGFGEEATYGEAATVSTFLEFNSEGVTQTNDRLESAAIRSSEFQSSWQPGSSGSEGDITMELSPVQTLLWKHALGAVASDEIGTSGAYEHVFTPDTEAMQDQSLTLQVVRDGIPFTYTGVHIASLDLSCDVDAFGELSVSLAGREELLNVAAATPVYADPYPLLTFVHGNLQIDAEDVAVNSVSLSLNNALNVDRRRLGSGLRRKPQRNGFRDLTGSLNCDFVDTGLYELFTSGVEASLELDFTSPQDAGDGNNYGLKVLTNVRFDGTTPTVGGPDEIRQELQIKTFPSAAVPTGVVVTIVNDAEDA